MIINLKVYFSHSRAHNKHVTVPILVNVNLSKVKQNGLQKLYSCIRMCFMLTTRHERKKIESFSMLRAKNLLVSIAKKAPKEKLSGTEDQSKPSYFPCSFYQTKQEVKPYLCNIDLWDPYIYDVYH